MNIGIDKNRNLVYEGSGHWGHPVWPTPVLTPARIVFASEGKLEAEDRNAMVGDAWYFREDSYEPSSRIRRGRFYFAGNTQPVDWHVDVHPATPSENQESDKGIVRKSLETFYGNPIWYKFLKDKREQPLVLLGFKERFTIWTLIGVEAISTGEDLVTLKSRSGMGTLPVMDERHIPDTHRAALRESLDGFADVAHRSAPVTVIDRARDAASHVLLAYFDAKPESAKDLGALAKRLEDAGKVIGASAAKIIARLHARAKPVEKIKRPNRPIREQDAELAIQCVGVILCEVGWADWA
jgi:hypothetical protein